MSRFSSGSLSIAWCVAIAPIVTVLPSDRMPPSPSADRSTTALGLFNRCFSTGMNVCPPAIAFASSAPNARNASGSVAGFT